MTQTCNIMLRVRYGVSVSGVKELSRRAQCGAVHQFGGGATVLLEG